MVEVALTKPIRVTNDRGWFSEAYFHKAAMMMGIAEEFVQASRSLSGKVATAIGLHFRTVSRAQAKLIYGTQNRLINHAADLRRSSPTWGLHAAAKLTAEEHLAVLYIRWLRPCSCPTEPDVKVAYKLTDHYALRDGSSRLDDRGVAIYWPMAFDQMTLV